MCVRTPTRGAIGKNTSAQRRGRGVRVRGPGRRRGRVGLHRGRFSSEGSTGAGPASTPLLGCGVIHEETTATLFCGDLSAVTRSRSSPFADSSHSRASMSNSLGSRVMIRPIANPDAVNHQRPRHARVFGGVRLTLAATGNLLYQRLQSRNHRVTRTPPSLLTRRVPRPSPQREPAGFDASPIPPGGASSYLTRAADDGPLLKKVCPPPMNTPSVPGAMLDGRRDLGAAEAHASVVQAEAAVL